MKLGGFSPLPCHLGGGTPRVKLLLDSLNADRGTAFDATTSTTKVYAENMSFARAISAAWGTNERLSRIWIPERMPMDVLARWEKIMGLAPAPEDSDKTRRGRVADLFERFGQDTVAARISSLLTAELGSVFVAVEYISYANAIIMVPDGTYPWGSVGTSPWSSTVAHILIKLQKPTGYTEGDFYDAAGRVPALLDPILPVWSTVDWYRPGPISVNVSGGPSAGGFYLDDDHNLDNECFDV